MQESSDSVESVSLHLLSDLEIARLLDDDEDEDSQASQSIVKVSASRSPVLNSTTGGPSPSKLAEHKRNPEKPTETSLDDDQETQHHQHHQEQPQQEGTTSTNQNRRPYLRRSLRISLRIDTQIHHPNDSEAEEDSGSSNSNMRHKEIDSTHEQQQDRQQAKYRRRTRSCSSFPTISTLRVPSIPNAILASSSPCVSPSASPASSHHPESDSWDTQDEDEDLAVFLSKEEQFHTRAVQAHARMYVLEQTQISSLHRKLVVYETLDKIFIVNIGKSHSCSCKDTYRPCKHLLFIFFNLFQITEDAANARVPGWSQRTTAMMFSRVPVSKKLPNWLCLPPGKRVLLEERLETQPLPLSLSLQIQGTKTKTKTKASLAPPRFGEKKNATNDKKRKTKRKRYLVRQTETQTERQTQGLLEPRTTRKRRKSRRAKKPNNNMADITTTRLQNFHDSKVEISQSPSPSPVCLPASQFCKQTQVMRQSLPELCGICREEITNKSNHLSLFWCRDQCGHNFHIGCASQWATIGKRNCPMCRVKWIFSEFPDDNGVEECQRKKNRKRTWTSTFDTVEIE